MRVNPRIKRFISDILMVDEEKGEIIISIKKLILKTFPKTEQEIKYGGLVYIIDSRLFCGIFLRKNHISIEFDCGAAMSDPDNFLEGKGKFRRHLKIREPNEIKDKKVKYYLSQLF